VSSATVENRGHAAKFADQAHPGNGDLAGSPPAPADSALHGELPRSRSAPKVELAPLTGLRFAAAFSILLMHTVEWTVPFRDTRVPITIAAVIGTYGMPLFFVLSGFVIHYNYGSLFRGSPYPVALREFLAARFARIYPLFIFFCIFGAVSDFTADWIPYAPRTFLSYIVHSITLTQSWVYKIVVNHRLLLDNGFGLGWSVSTEFFFYLAYAVLVFAILLIRRPVTSLIVLVVFTVAVIGGLTAAYVHADQLMDIARAHVTHFIAARDDFSNSFYRWLFYYSPYMRVWEFLLGCLTAHLFVLLQGRKVTRAESSCGLVLLWLALASLLALGILHATNVPGSAPMQFVHFLELNFGCALPIAIVIFCSARYRTAFAALMSLPWIVWLGDISYSVYAVHTWTVRPFIRPPVDLSTANAIDAILRVSFAVAFTVIAATATYAIIELPCRRYLRAKLMRRGSQPPTAAADAAELPRGLVVP
jgi:peptidoglycan/LPS O-acetylase OafA/YrhL